MRFLRSGLAVWVLLVSVPAGLAAAAEGFALEKTASVVLDKSRGRVDQVIHLDSGEWLVRDADYANEEQQYLERYDAVGERLGVIGQFGRGPGQFFRLKDVEVDSRGRVWVADVLGRISVFSGDGELEKTLLIKRPGYQVNDLALDEKRGFFYLTGCLAKETFLDLGCTLVHRYRLRDWYYVDSFVETDAEALSKHLLPLEDYLIDVDGAGVVHMVDAPLLRVFSVDPEVGSVIVRGLPSDRAEPAPNLTPGQDVEINRRLYRDAYLVDRLVAVGDCLVASVRRPGAAGYLLTALEASSRRVLARDAESPGRLVGKGEGGDLLFVRREGEKFVIEVRRAAACAGGGAS